MPSPTCSSLPLPHGQKEKNILMLFTSFLILISFLSGIVKICTPVTVFICFFVVPDKRMNRTINFMDWLKHFLVAHILPLLSNIAAPTCSHHRFRHLLDILFHQYEANRYHKGRGLAHSFFLVILRQYS